jgi:hypothetical protein
MRKVRRLVLAVTMAASMVFATAAIATAAPLPDNCTKDKGVVTCTTTESPGNNQGGVGSTEETTSQGNTSNTNPEGSDGHTYPTDCTQNPPKSNGWFACP